ncbi:hypothetical protein OIE71_05615 [Streptomyces sp. NBC_01725]|uniref:hypothetical protein n=1 Tax=Streptomyces sp. NBC_01725 TaxID=2975923 RepID=UPI002E2C3179|nr:hypothetical protein [Streptomyces sp. NBC_01725]
MSDLPKAVRPEPEDASASTPGIRRVMCAVDDIENARGPSSAAGRAAAVRTHRVTGVFPARTRR